MHTLLDDRLHPTSAAWVSGLATCTSRDGYRCQGICAETSCPVLSLNQPVIDDTQLGRNVARASGFPDKFEG